MEETIKKCLTCGGDLEPDSKGIPTCKFCGRQYKDAVGEYSSELKEIVNRRQLREFIQAEELGRELLKKQPESSEVYWQILLASLGVVYVQADGKSKPTFFSYSYDDRTLIADNENYKNAIKYAKSVENRRYYEAQAQELDTLLKEFFGLVAKEASYDIFISFKRTVTATVGGEERQIDTDDYYKAKEIYEYLSKKYKVFFSPVSIGQDTGIEGEKYEPRILKALQTSQAMILLGSCAEYLEAQWVQNEWRRYQYFINKGKKDKSSLILGYEKFMPALPTALKDIQLPSFDWFKASYLKDLESKLTFVKTSKGIKSTIKERKINSDFGADASFGSYTGKRVTISGAENIGIVLSPNEARELDEANKVLQNGDFFSAKKLYDRIIYNNGNNAAAFWGRFKANIKVRTDSEVPQRAATNIEDIYLKDIESAIVCSTDEKFSWNIVDLLVEALTYDGALGKVNIIFEYIIKYLDDRRAASALYNLTHNAIDTLKSNVNAAEDIFGNARKLFFDENKDEAMSCLEAYAGALFDGKHFDLARKYYEELASIQRSNTAYFNLLACRVGVTDLSKAKFALNVNPDDDASIKKPSELDLDEIIERILICNNEAGDSAADARVEGIALYQIHHNKKNCKPFIETIVSCYAALDKKAKTVDFLMKVAERFIQIKDFKNAKLYYNEVLSHNPNCSKAHWGLLMVRFKAIDENDLIKHRKALIDAPEYQNAKNCADNDEFAHYTDILNGVKQYYKNPYGNNPVAVPKPNKHAYIYLALIIALLIAIIASIVTAVTVSNHNDKVARAGLKYGLSSDGTYYSVSGIEGDECLESYVIPSSYKGKPVTGISANAFKDCKNLKIITIPDSVTSIGIEAFYGCSSLTSISIPNSVTSIGEQAFRNCTKLTSVTIPDSVTNIGGSAFEGCVNIVNVAMPAWSIRHIPQNSLQTVVITSGDSIGEMAFRDCSSLKNVTIGNGVTSIGEKAFRDCACLASATIGNGVTSIGEQAFYGCTCLKTIYWNATHCETEGGYYGYIFEKCTALTTVHIGENVENIPSYVFNGCTNLTEVYITDIKAWCNIEFGDIPFYSDGNLYLNNELVTEITADMLQGVNEIKNYAFDNCTSLTNVTIPNSVTSIGNSVFNNCTSMASITIPDSVISIGDYAFSDCKKLTSITIPASVTSIGSYAFEYCTSLASIAIPDSVTTIGSYAFRGCKNIVNAAMPALAISYIPQNSLQTVLITSGESIGERAFRDCSSLESICIPHSVTSIGSYAFYNCKNLKKAYFSDPEGWSASNHNISASELSNSATAATYLNDQYNYCEWKKTV